MRRRRAYDRDASRDAIVGAAMRLFAEHGFAATRVEDIVRAAGYTRGAFYFHFANKLDCFWTVVEHREELRGDWVAAATAGLDPGTTSLEQVLARVLGRFAAAEQGASGWVLVMVDLFQQHRDEPEVQARLAEIYAGWRGTVARLVETLQAGGWVPPERDPELLAAQAFGYVEGLTAHGRMYGVGVERALLDGLVKLLTA